MLKIPWTARVTNDEVLERMAMGRELMKSIRKRQMKFLGHIMRQNTLENLSLTGNLEGRRTKRRAREKFMNGLVRYTGLANIVAGLLQMTRDRKEWSYVVANVFRGTAVK